MIVGASFHVFNAIVLLIPAFLNCLAMYPLFIDFGHDESAVADEAARPTELKATSP
jgi:hypothetical protein